MSRPDRQPQLRASHYGRSSSRVLDVNDVIGIAIVDREAHALAEPDQPLANAAPLPLVDDPDSLGRFREEHGSMAAPRCVVLITAVVAERGNDRQWRDMAGPHLAPAPPARRVRCRADRLHERYAMPV